jgi:hypothetical protein
MEDSLLSKSQWFKKMNLKQKMGWKVFFSLINKMENQKVNLCLWIFSIRLTLMIFPMHKDALLFLKHNTSLYIIRKIENFIMSNQYSVFRKNNKIGTLRKVPETFLCFLQKKGDGSSMV